MNGKIPSLSPLQLKSYCFPIVNVRANPNGKATALTSAQQEVGFFPVPGQPNHWNLQLAVKLASADANNPFFYEVEIHALGVVEMSGDVPAEKRETLAVVNGLGILYGACREMLMNVTARSLFGPCSIPSLSFAQVLQEAKEHQIEQQKSRIGEEVKSTAALAG
jgi:preprotein translocase subunit SecB